ncbi:hypothetical protein EJ03DRAFT_358539 [Teratosphaeria nubilosa]|uniref:Vacuolar protein sorting-associated protein 51 homolog n=1 Tax=Teratosphaeria nubilosa TaxID=161662 RepID=A0A6G1KVD5_9PEZI|nr:hypothetical protein EJ03DRAFT_358539 [Teratosphaeria nubilosa]
MSTITSPRPSIALSSRRTSTSTDRSTSTTRASNPPTAPVRRGNRDRAALRDYYNLPKPAADAPAPPTPKHETETESELDQPNFHAESYVKHLLEKEGLEGVLRVESRLVSEIRSLDGEKKALVYDNYSKLITATDTIRAMREKMDPGAQTMTLVADIERIGETAAGLQKELRKSHEGRGGGGKERHMQRETVRWVLAASESLGRLVREGKRDDAEAEWRVVEGLLGRWEGVRGVEEVREACREALGVGEG